MQMAHNPELEATLEELRRAPSTGFEFTGDDFPESDAPPAREGAARAKQNRGARKPPPAARSSNARLLEARLQQRADATAGRLAAKQSSKTRAAPPTGDRRAGRRSELRANEEESISGLLSRGRQVPFIC